VQPSRRPEDPRSRPPPPPGAAPSIAPRGRARSSNGRRAAHPVEHLRRRLAWREDPYVELARPVGPLGLGAPPRVRRPFDIAQHRLGLWGKRDSTITRWRRRSTMWSTCSIDTGHRLDAGAARHAVPHDVIGDGAPGRAGVSSAAPRRAAPARRRDLSRSPMIRSFGESALPVAERRQGPGSGRTRAGEGVRHLLPGQVRDRSRSEAQILLVVGVEVQRAPAVRARGLRPNQTFDRRRRDVAGCFEYGR